MTSMDIYNLLKSLNENIRIYITQGNLINHQGNLINLSNDDDYITKLKNKLKEKKQINYTLKRDHYYSQIRDIDTKKNTICYINEQNTLNIINIDKKNFIINKYEIINQPHDSFPNLHKYHFTTNIKKTEYIFNNIKLIIENNIVFIEINKNYDINDLDFIFKLILI